MGGASTRGPTCSSSLVCGEQASSPKRASCGSSSDIKIGENLSLCNATNDFNDFKSRLNDHFAILKLLYDHRAPWDFREGLGDRSLCLWAAGSCSAEHQGNSQ